MRKGLDGIRIPEGFQVEIVRRAGPGEGSWVSMAFSPDGSLFVSPQAGKILRFPPGKQPGSLGDPASIPFPVGRAQGLCWANDSLYVNVVGSEDGDGGLHRLLDLDGDGKFDEHRHLKAYGPASEHGAHGILPGPDGTLFMVWGNHVRVPAGLTSKGSPFKGFKEDVLLPSIPDPRGHARGISMPAGTLWRTDKDGRNWDLLAGGMRNVYDIAFTKEGDLFGYDADMEWDIGTPWYRPPRLLHLVSGGDYGWRTGSAKLDPESPDTLPAVVDTDFSSPTAVLATRHLAQPEAFGGDLLLGDWAYGRILAVDLHKEGASFGGSVRVFAEGRPWNITDLVSGPEGNLWVLTGGRGTPSTLYRIGPVGREPRQSALENRSPPKTWRGEGLLASDSMWGDLDSPDRFVRWGARLTLERTPLSDWEERALRGDGLPALARAEARLALARTAPHRAAEIWRGLLGQGWVRREAVLLLELRTAQVLLARHEESISVTDQGVFSENLFKSLPTLKGLPRRFALELLVALKYPGMPGVLLPSLHSSQSQEKQIHAAYLLRLVGEGWTAAFQKRAIDWTRTVRSQPGGASLEGFLDQITLGLRDVSGPDEWDRVVAGLPPPPPPDWEVGVKKRNFVRKWSTASALKAVERFEPHASADKGFKVLGEAGCLACHRFNANGHGIGPDLTGAGRRFDRRTLLEAILEPSKVVSDQYLDIPMPPGLLDTFGPAEIANLLLFLELGAR
jgi:glucose/arabinose dehydrogenase